MKKIILILLIVNCSLLIVKAQPTQEWVARYAGVGLAECIAVDSAGNIFAAGVDGEQPSGFSTVKFNPQGQLLWHRHFTTFKSENGTKGFVPIPKKMASDANGNIYIGVSDFYYIVVKYDANGNFIFAKSYGTNLVDFTIDTSANLIMTGYGTGVTTVKANFNGDTLWTRSYNQNSSGPDNLDYNINGQIFVSGVININTTVSMLTLGYNSTGSLLWSRSFQYLNGFRASAWDIAAYKNQYVYVIGSGRVDSVQDDFITLKYDLAGNLKWVRTYGGSGHYDDLPRLIRADVFGNAIVAGWDFSMPLTGADYCTVKYDSLGNQLWVRHYDGPAHFEDHINDVAIDKIGGIYVTGSITYIFDSTSFVPKMATIKYDKDGNQDWIRIYPDPVRAQGGATSVIVDKYMNVFVAGFENGSNSSVYNGMFLIKYSQPMGIKPISNEIPKEFNLYQNYPNPFNPSTKIKFDIPGGKSINIKIRIYDITGKEIKTLANESVQPGTYQILFDASGLSSGVYFYKISSETYNDAKKMLYVK